MATAFSPGSSSNWSSDGTSLRCGLVRPTASRRLGFASQTAATSVSGQLVKFRMRLGPQYPAPTMPTGILLISPRLVKSQTSNPRRQSPDVKGPMSDDVREALLDAAEVE